jgi:hypothetical protein
VVALRLHLAVVVVDMAAEVMVAKQPHPALVTLAAVAVAEKIVIRALALAAPASSSFDTGLRNGSFCTNRRTRHGANSHRGE